MALKVKIFRGDVENAFNKWSETSSAQIATAEYVLNERDAHLVVFYQEKPKPEQSDLLKPGPMLVKP